MIISNEKVQKAFDFLLDSAKEYAQAIANEHHLDKFEKKLLAKLKTESSETSDASKTREAYNHAEYETWLNGYKEAVYRLHEIRTRRENAQLAIEIWRSEQATERMKLKI